MNQTGIVRLVGTVAALLPILTSSLRAGCGNSSDKGTSSPPCTDCTGAEGECTEGGSGGANKFNVYNGNVHRNITDLQVVGSIGLQPLAFTRFANSRANNTGKWFGPSQGWRHSYQWDMVSAGTNGSGQAMLDLSYPAGEVVRFTQTSTGVWGAGASIQDRLTSVSGTYWYLQRPDGTVYTFRKITSGGTYYQLETIKDAIGNTTNLTYDSNRQLYRVTDATGRYLQLSYTDAPYTGQSRTQLHLFANNVTGDQWTEIPITNTSSFRYLYYTVPEDWSFVRELEFYDVNNVKINGTTIGTLAFNGYEASRAFDGDTETEFFPVQRDSYVGLDLGAGVTKQVSKIRFYTDSYLADWTSNGRFYGSNNNPSATKRVISRIDDSNGRSVVYQYTNLTDPTLGYQYVCLSGADYGDGTAAAYGYSFQLSGQAPLLTEVNDPRHVGPAARLKYEYNSEYGVPNGLIWKEKNAVTDTVMVTRNDADNTVTYANGAIQKFDLPETQRGNVNKYADGLNRPTNYAYDASGTGFLLSKTNARGHTTTYTRDAQARPLTISYPDGGFESYTYDSLGQILTRSVKQSATVTLTTTYTRNPVTHQVTRIDYPDSSYETYTYNAFGQPLTHRLRNGGIETMAYDTRGLLTSATNADNKTTTYAYYLGTEAGQTHAKDRLKSVTDPLLRTTTYEYNARGQVLKVIHPDDIPLVPSRLHYTYDTYGSHLTTTNEIGNTWTNTYDEFKRLVTSVDPLNRTTTYSYTLPGVGGCGCAAAANKPTKITLPSGKITKFTYDVEWQKTSETVGYGTIEAATTSYAYNYTGAVKSVTDPNGKAWTKTLDNRNRVKTAVDPLGNTTTWTYDLTGNNLSIKRPDNGVTTHTYDVMNRLVSTKDPANQMTTYAYGGCMQGDGTFGSNMVCLTDARGTSYNFTYDILGRQTSMIYPAATSGGTRGHEDWTYDAVGNVATYTTRAGQVKTCTHDARNRDLLCDWSDSTPDVSRMYDAAGRLLTLNNSVSALTYTYDAANQMLSEKQDISGAAMGVKTLSYTYDADGNRATLTYPDGKVVTYHYTARNQVDSIDYDGAPPMVDYGYDLGGNRLSKVLENGTNTVYTYDNASRILSVDHSLTINGQPSHMVCTYGLNAVGNRTDRTEVIAGVSKRDHYTYTADDQIDNVRYNWNQAANTQDRIVDYNFDAVGNRSTVSDNGVGSTYSTNNLNQYTSFGTSAAPAYDTNGNIAQVQKAPGGPIEAYTYDAQNRLISGSHGETIFQFGYDGRNRCVRRMVGGAAVCLLYDDWDQISEFDSEGMERRRTVNGASSDEILSTITQAGTLCHYQDGLGNTVAVSNASSELVERYTYDVFGAPSIFSSSGVVLTKSANGIGHLFTGREWIGELSIYDYRNRVYSQTLGRFFQKDPIGFSANDVNLYRYVRNDPADLFDPLGLQASLLRGAGKAIEVGDQVNGFLQLIDRILGGESEPPQPPSSPTPVPPNPPGDAPQIGGPCDSNSPPKKVLGVENCDFCQPIMIDGVKGKLKGPGQKDCVITLICRAVKNKAGKWEGPKWIEDPRKKPECGPCRALGPGNPPTFYPDPKK